MPGWEVPRKFGVSAESRLNQLFLRGKIGRCFLGTVPFCAGLDTGIRHIPTGAEEVIAHLRKKKAEHNARPSPTGRYEATRPRAVNLHDGQLGSSAASIKSVLTI
jgi:hypothetical protein